MRPVLGSDPAAGGSMALLASYRLKCTLGLKVVKFHVIGISFCLLLGTGGSSWCARKSNGLGGQDFDH